MPPKRSRETPQLSLTLRFRFRGEVAMGPGKADLLEAIEKARSISAAARDLGMSYRRAWVLVDTMNRCFRKPLVETQTGGPEGGGARVTPVGREVARRFRSMEARALAAVARDRQRIARALAVRGKRWPPP